MKPNIPDFYNSLDKTYLKIWELLEVGLQNRDAPFHIPVFICTNDNSADGRVVVLRGVSKEDKNLWFHTDIRSRKIKVLKNNPIATLLFYDKEEKVQLRIIGKTKVNYKNDTTKKSWASTSTYEQTMLSWEKAPGSIVSSPTSGLTEKIDNYKYSIEDSEIGYENFCVVEFFIQSIEWLYLAAKGHRRAYFNLKTVLLKKNG